MRCVAAAPVAQRVIKEVGWRSMMGQMGWVVSHTMTCIAGTWVAFCQECQQRSCGQEAVRFGETMRRAYTMATDDAQEGGRAFREKRQPVWTGKSRL